MSKPSFADRKRARRIAMQALYSWLLSKNTANDIETYSLAEHAQDSFDREYFKILLFSVIEQAETLNELLAPNLSRAVDELDYIEHAILWIAAYELQSRYQDNSQVK